MAGAAVPVGAVPLSLEEAEEAEEAAVVVAAKAVAGHSRPAAATVAARAAAALMVGTRPMVCGLRARPQGQEKKSFFSLFVPWWWTRCEND